MADKGRSWGRRIRVPVLAGLLVMGLSLGSRMPRAHVATAPPAPKVAVLTLTAPKTGAVSSPQAPVPVAQFAAAAHHAAPTRPPTQKPVVPFTRTDVLMIAQVIHGEAAGQPVDARLGVGAVIVNRVRLRRFGATIRSVIEAPGQFQTVGSALFASQPPHSDVRLAQEAIDGIDPTGGALYFYNPARTAVSAWIRRLPILVRFGAISFAR